MHTTNNGVKIQTQTSPGLKTSIFHKATLIKLVFMAVIVADGWHMAFSAREQNRAFMTWGQGRESVWTSKKDRRLIQSITYTPN